MVRGWTCSRHIGLSASADWNTGTRAVEKAGVSAESGIGFFRSIGLLRFRELEWSDLQEDLPSIHPKQHQPIDKQDCPAEQERLQSRSEAGKQAVAEVNTKAASHEIFA